MLSPRSPAAPAFVLAALAGLAFVALGHYLLATGHPHEDAYILFTYSENLARGLGIVYYEGGPPTEGATDFLWMIALGASAAAGVDVAVAAMALSGAGLAMIVFITVRQIGEFVGTAGTWTLGVGFAVLLLVSPIAAAALAGFSTAVFCAVTVWMFDICLRADARRLATMPALALLCGLIRPEGVIVGAGFTALALWQLRATGERGRVLGWLAGATVAGAAYFAWRYGYFGEWLPLPLLVKSAGERTLAGLDPNLRWVATVQILLALAALATWHEKQHPWRYLAAFLPLLALFALLLFAHQSQNVAFRFQAPLTACLVLAAARWFASTAATGARAPAGAILTLVLAAGLIAPDALALRRTVRALQDDAYIHAFPLLLDARMSPPTAIALTEAGRMGFWTRGPKLDLVGLNSRDVAVNGPGVEALEAFAPDLVFLHTSRVLRPWSDATGDWFETDIESVLGRRDPRFFDREAGLAEDRAPAVGIEFLRRHPHRLVLVRYRGRYHHLYAIRRGGRLDFDDFVRALKESHSGRGSMSYLEMRQALAQR